MKEYETLFEEIGMIKLPAPTQDIRQDLYYTDFWWMRFWWWDGTGLVTCCEVPPKVYPDISKEEMIDMLVETVDSEDELEHVHEDVDMDKFDFNDEGDL